MLRRLTVPFSPGSLSRFVRGLTRPRALVLIVASLALAALGAERGVASSAGVVNVRLGGDSVHTRVVVELEAAAHGDLPAGAAAPNALVLDLAGAGVSHDLQGSGLGLVRAWSVRPNLGAARVELTLSANARVARRFLLPPGDGVKVYRYVMDLEPAPGSMAAANSSRAAPWLGAFDALTQVKASPAKRLVVIDAGHGGRDPGASGASTLEKRVTLAAAQALKARLERTGRYRVELTRSDDVYIALDTRVAIARKAGADLFISLHADAGPNASVHGASVYTLSEHGADRAARKVLSGDNWIHNVAAPNDLAVDRILLDLTQRATQNRSAAFAHEILDRIEGRTSILRRSQRDAGFAVLLAPDVPAVLLEMGFITNPDDEAVLTDPDRRARLMDAVADAVDDYFADDAHATSLAALP
jgi:N-acetylmuramoyl-L-alanine amidase